METLLFRSPRDLAQQRAEQIIERLIRLEFLCRPLSLANAARSHSPIASESDQQFLLWRRFRYQAEPFLK